jgi:hypothetical protein
MTEPIPDDKNLGVSGKALPAAAGMKALASEAAFQEMFSPMGCLIKSDKINLDNQE